MYDKNLPHAPASNRVTYVLLAGFPMSYSSIHAILTCILAEDHLYSSCYEGDASWESTHRSMHVDQITLDSYKIFCPSKV